MSGEHRTDDAGDLRTRTSLAEIVMATASALKANVQMPSEAIYAVWKRLLRDVDDTIVVESVSLFRRQLSNLHIQIEEVDFFQSDTKSFYLETVVGMRNSTEIPQLMSSWSNYGNFSESEKIGRLFSIRDILSKTSPVGRPTEKGMRALKEKLDDMYKILDEAEGINVSVRQLLRARLDSVNSALSRADLFGSELVLTAAGQLVGDVAIVLYAEGGRAPSSAPDQPLRDFAAKAIKFIDVAGRVSFLWDVTTFAIENAEKPTDVFRLLGSD